MDINVKEGFFDSSVESLEKYECPQWFRDAKFGIWAHWGPQCVPMVGDWYARNMYIEGSTMYKYHCEHYGHPSEFGYKDIIPLWKAENFDVDKLAKLYKKAGAKYLVSCGVHHDNFDCWNSKHQKWNSVNMGPKKDIVGMWQQAAKELDLHFGVTVHHERSYSWFNTNKGCDKEGKYAGVPYDGNDPAFEDLYYEPHEDNNMCYPLNPSESFVEGWYKRVKDVVESYNPDLLYTDGGVPFGEVGRKAIANFYNHNMEVNGGKLQAIYNSKDLRENDKQSGKFHGEFFPGTGVQDMERGVIDGISPFPWQTDTCIGQWYYKNGVEYKSAEYIIKMLCDIVSKNGNLLLNIPIKPDGTIDETEEKFLEEFGNWMKVNGDAIYATRPWVEYKEGDVAEAGEFKEQEIESKATSFRFTQGKDCVNAICFGWAEKFVIKSFAKGKIDFDIKDVELLGCDEKLQWTQTENGLEIVAPSTKPCDTAYSFKIIK